MKINFNDQFSLGNSDLVHIEGKENARVRYLKLLETLNFKITSLKNISKGEKKEQRI